MPDRLALIVAMDQPLSTAFAGLPYNESGAHDLAESLTKVGYSQGHVISLLGPQATMAAIQSRVRKLRKSARKGDTILLFLAGSGFTEGGKSRFHCWDSLPDDLAGTSIAIADLLQDLTSSRASQVVVLLDVGTAAPTSGGEATGFDLDELETIFATSPKAAALLACEPSLPSHSAAALNRTAWVHAIVEAFAGRAARAAAADDTLSAIALQRHLEAELPRVLRKHFAGNVAQQPMLLGEQNTGAVVADLSAVVRAAGGLLDPDRLKRVVFRSETYGRVRELEGFRKTFQVPDRVSPSSQKFVARCAAAQLRADLDAVHAAVREHLGYKRKDMESGLSADGVGALRTPDFEYTTSVLQDTTDPAGYVWRRELGQLADASFARSASFAAIFGRQFDQLSFEFTRAVDVDAFVDRLEDTPLPGVRVTVESDGGACEVSLAGYSGRVRIERRSLTIFGRTGHAAGLLDQFLAFMRTFADLGDASRLSTKSG